MKTNTAVKAPNVHTHEGAPAARINATQQLRRSVMAGLLWEDTFYESGQEIGERIKELVAVVDPLVVSQIASEARNQMYLRHMPLLLARELARHPRRASDPHVVADTLFEVIQRPDELAEFLSLYWKDGRQPLSAQVKKGLARAFNKFGAYQVAKYNRAAAVKLRDVAFLSHVKPNGEGESREIERKYKDGSVKRLARHPGSVLGQLIEGTLPTPDTWETNLSAGKDKAETFRRLLDEGKLGGLAFLRNLRNMVEAGIAKKEITAAVARVNFARVLPFRFIAAARVMPQLEDVLEPLMLSSTAELPILPGKTVVLVDVSGSMRAALSSRSDMQRTDAAFGLAIILRELCADVQIAAFEGQVHPVPPRRGFALRDVLNQWNGSTYLGAAVAWANAQKPDRIVAITDEQSHDAVPAPVTKRAYMLNVATYKNGVGYHNGWTHIEGFSENVVRYIAELEKAEEAV